MNLHYNIKNLIPKDGSIRENCALVGSSSFGIFLSCGVNMIIYKATNQINGKVYIGQTIRTMQSRKNRHILDAYKNNDNYFHRAIKKYGVDNFKWEVICICPNINSLNEQEKYYIVRYNSKNKGYNLKSGGLNGRHSKSSKNKIRLSMLGKKNHFYGKHHTKETKEKIRQDHLGKKLSKKTKKKISKAGIGRIVSKETRIKIGRFNSDKIVSDKTKDKLRNIALNMSDETKEKISEAMKGKCHTEKTKKKMSESRLQYFKKIKGEIF